MTNEEAIDLLDNLLGMIDDNQGNDYDEAIHRAIGALSAEPEIIRCKDCKYWEESFPFDLCMLTKAKNNIWRSDETDFCSWAERREE